MPRLPKRVPMAPWTIRITTEYQDIQQIVELITDKELTSGTYVLGYETTSRDGSPAEPHFHGYFETVMTQQQIRDKLRDLGYSKRYSISPPKSGQFICPTACAYCIKYGKYQTANIKQELIDEWIANNERQVEEFKQAKKAKKEQKESMYKRVEAYLIECGYKETDSSDNTTEMEMKAHRMMKDIMDYHDINQTPIRKNTIVFLGQSFMCKFDQRYKQEFTYSVAKTVVML